MRRRQLADDQQTEKTSGDAVSKAGGADAIEKDDPHKVEKLSKLGCAGDEAAEGEE